MKLVNQAGEPAKGRHWHQAIAGGLGGQMKLAILAREARTEKEKKNCSYKLQK